MTPTRSNLRLRLRLSYHGQNRLRNAIYYDDSGRTLNSLRRMGGLTSGRQPGVRSELGPETNSWVGCQAARPCSTEEGPSAVSRAQPPTQVDVDLDVLT